MSSSAASLLLLTFVPAALAGSEVPSAQPRYSRTVDRVISTPYMWVGSNGGANTISRVDTVDGGVTTFSNTGTADRGAVDPAGNLWVTAQGEGRIRKLSASNGAVTNYDSGFPSPGAIAIDAAGDVCVGQVDGGHGVFKLKGSDGSLMWDNSDVTAVAGPLGLAVDALGNVWVPDYAKDGKVYKLDGSDGKILGVYDAGDWPTGIAVDGSGDVWVTNQLSGTVTQLDGADGSLLGTYRVASMAVGIAIDDAGNLWVTNNAHVAKVAPDGRVIGVYRAGGNTSGGVSVDASGNVWVINPGASSVTKLSPAGVVIGTYRGMAASGDLGDFTGFALQRFVMRGPSQRRPQPVARKPIQRPPKAALRVVEAEPRPLHKGKPRPDDFALVVGVERYRSLPVASYAERDASAFVRYARTVLGVPEENTILLTGERATKTDIAKYVEEWLPRNVVEASRVYVFYSGHGAPDPAKGTAHLVPWDGDPAFLQTSAYPLSRLYERLSRLKAREVVVMLDACFSGTGGRSVIAHGLRPLVLVREAVVPKGDKLTVLTAASSDETAGSLDSQRHGLFTYYLLKGLDGAADPEGSGHVDVGGLHGYVRQNVLRAARRQNREQNPVLRAPDKGLRLY